MTPLIIGTRGSPLALAQSNWVRDRLMQAHPGRGVELKIIKTSGDIFQAASLTASAGKGLFTKEIEEQLLRGEIHLAVHSMKDLPTTLPAGLIIGAVPEREDVHDVFIAKKFSNLDELPEGAHVATSSIRRCAQLKAYRPDLQIEEIRGNVETRLRKLADNSALDALILAAAGLKRLGLWQTWGNLHWQRLEFDVMIPAVGQGAIAIEIRSADLATQAFLAAITDRDAMACTAAERAFLHTLGGGCQVPYAAHATTTGPLMHLIGAKFSPDGEDIARTRVTGPATDPIDLGERAAKELMK